ncbi:MAG: hypothetical protein JO100_05505 [Pseudonocardia sp.]|nr:hypothetical protein [Pseudonocardia sp.]
MEPTPIPATEVADARLVWVGLDDRSVELVSVELESVALDLPDEWLVIHVMPTALRKKDE